MRFFFFWKSAIASALPLYSTTPTARIAQPALSAFTAISERAIESGMGMPWGEGEKVTTCMTVDAPARRRISLR